MLIKNLYTFLNHLVTVHLFLGRATELRSTVYITSFIKLKNCDALPQYQKKLQAVKRFTHNFIWTQTGGIEPPIS